MVEEPEIVRGWKALMRSFMTALVLACALVFLVAASTKITSLDEFATTLARQHGLQKLQNPNMALVLAVGEMVFASSVLWLLMRRRLGLAAGGLAVAFAAVSIYAAYLAVNPPPRPVGCGCGFSERLLLRGDWLWLSGRNAAGSVAMGGVCMIVMLGRGWAAGAERTLSSLQTNCVP